MTPDPYMASGGPSDPQSWNRYAYAEGDPVNGVDPTGQFVQSPCTLWGISSWACSPFAGMWPSPGTSGPGLAYFCAFDPGCMAQFAQHAPSLSPAQTAAGTQALGLVNLAYFGQVLSLALQALGSHDCAAIYNTGGTSDYTPQMVLQSMVPGGAPSGYWFGTISFAPGTYAAQTNIGGYVPGYGFTVANIEINTGSGGDFFNGDLVNSVDTLLHELGHAFGFLPALGGSKIINDANKDGTPNAAAEAANEAALAPCRTATEALLK